MDSEKSEDHKLSFYLLEKKRAYKVQICVIRFFWDLKRKSRRYYKSCLHSQMQHIMLQEVVSTHISGINLF